jgi:hypothetical protein
MAKNSMIAIALFQLTLNLLVSLSMQQFLSALSLVQIVVFHTMINLAYPANAQVFNSILL